MAKANLYVRYWTNNAPKLTAYKAGNAWPNIIVMKSTAFSEQAYVWKWYSGPALSSTYFILSTKLLSWDLYNTASLKHWDNLTQIHSKITTITGLKERITRLIKIWMPKSVYQSSPKSVFLPLVLPAIYTLYSLKLLLASMATKALSRMRQIVIDRFVTNRSVVKLWNFIIALNYWHSQ